MVSQWPWRRISQRDNLAPSLVANPLCTSGGGERKTRLDGFPEFADYKGCCVAGGDMEPSMCVPAQEVAMDSSADKAAPEARQPSFASLLLWCS